MAGPLRAIAAASAPPTRPNFLILLTDDQRWDMMGCAGNPIIQTPNMDWLARNGVQFMNAFVTTSICAASRASIFTGLYERTHQFTFGTPPLRDEFADMSYPALLRAAGYRTGFVGKFGMSVGREARDGMFDSFKPLGRGPYFKKRRDGTVRHLTDITGDEAIAFLRDDRRDQPFCLSVSFNAPHAEDRDPKQYFWPKSVDHLYRDVAVPVPRTADPAFFEQQPPFLKESLNRVRWRWRFDTPKKQQEMTKGYYRMISGVDGAMGRIMAELRKLKLDDNTVVVFTGDNGYFLGERGFAGKWLMHEESIRVPLVVFDPREDSAARGSRPDQMALNVDIAPTVLRLAGIGVPEKTQGRSLVPLLKGEHPQWRTDFFYEHLFNTRRIPKTEGVRTERWKYARYFEQAPVHEELYDLASDRHEERNLVGDEQHAAMLDSLRKRCDELRDRYGGPYVPRPKPSRKPVGRPAPASFTEGVKGRAAVFDGKATYLPLGSIPALGKDAAFSWAFWVYLEPGSRHSGVVVGNRRLPRKDTTQFMKVTPQTVQYYNGRKNAIRMQHKIPTAKWVHVAVVKDVASLTCHTDGRQVASAEVGFDMPSLPLYLGGDPHTHEMAACRLDEVRIYGRALTPEEIAALAGLKDVDGDLLGYWPLDDSVEPQHNAAQRK